MLNPGNLNVNGKLIALEGESEVISTHIRLLPPSHKILVFPTLQDSSTTVDDPGNFDPKLFIRNVHAAFTQRVNVANSFLQTSEPEHPRLVFMNGGSIRARTICIEGICKNLTAGDIRAAETIFNDLIKDGLAGLMRNEENTQNQSLSYRNPVDQDPSDKVAENVITNDQEEVNKDINETAKHSPQVNESGREMLSLEKKYLDEEIYHSVGNCSPVGSTCSRYKSSTNNGSNKTQSLYQIDNNNVLKEKSIPINEDKIVKTTFTLMSKEPTLLRDQLTISSPTCLTPSTTSLSIPGAYLQDSKNDSRRNSNILDLTINDISFPSTPTTAERMTFTPQRFDDERPRSGRPNSGMESYEVRDYAHIPLPSGSDLHLRRRPQPLGELNASNFDSFSSDSSQIDNKSVKLMSHQGSYSSLQISAKEKCAYVVENCNTEEQSDEVREVKDEPYVPIFEVVEDLIIHFADSATNTIFSNVLRSCQGGKFPAHRPTSWSENLISSKRYSGILPRPKTSYPKEGGISSQENATHINNFTSLGSKSDKNGIFGDSKHQPPTPAITPPKISDTNSKTRTKSLTFSSANSSNLISAHNCFRRLLSSHLTAGKNGYTQYYQSVPAQADRLWKPVFGNWNISECVLKKTAIDQIIALGCASAVENDFKSQITGMVERLGSKRSGLSRSDKIDLSYLISNAMQNLNPLTFNKHITDPQPGPSVIATLLIPQLESYFAYHSSTQVLVLQFLSSQLPIIYALRELLGNTLFKIAGISTASNTTPTQYPPSPVSPNPLLNDAVPSCDGNKTFMKYDNYFSSNPASDYFVPVSPSTVSNLEVEESFSGANFILSNLASNEEITRFISDIRQTLIEKSSFYLPEPEPEPRTIVQVVEKYITAPPVPVTRPSSQHRSSIIEGSVQDGVYKSNSRRHSTKAGRHSNNGIHTPLSEFIAKRNYAASIASSRRTCTSSISELEGWENFEIGDDESDFDEYDRMILGSKMTALILGKQLFSGGKQNEISQQGVASKRKALKWLGLA
ncbi:putative gastric mucin-like protein [Erysiphe neolycopersici]|uniref:Putative gastric mucin-like protein n=1 Tax=Erysiphe neolycopersici TaxID=212602 RepID=A0A420HQM8_9PEZI|nr:putative gastric mucin-like protein [Erysiphe neolycopersici]